MKVLIVGTGISGLSAAVALASRGEDVIMISPFPSERAQSVMVAGGINAVDEESEDSFEAHIGDTLKGGRFIAGKEAVKGLCEEAPSVIRELEQMGTVFARDENGKIRRRAFGGQSFDRTCYSGTSTGKQIVTALRRELRRYESQGKAEIRLGTDFHSALIEDGRCYGILAYDERYASLAPIYADAVIIASGGQNALYGKTTGSTACDGYTAGRLFMQGAVIKNPEFVQFHPTTYVTPQKNMLISEAARGEGGRLFYVKDSKRVYFMEDLFGPKGNLMPREVVSRSIFNTGEKVFLDVSFLGGKKIRERMLETYELCMKYGGLDITEEPIPVTPSVHFFMGGLAVDNGHMTNIDGLYAAGECASIYHGANRLGGNSMLAAFYGGKVAAGSIIEREEKREAPLFDGFIRDQETEFNKILSSSGRKPVTDIRSELAQAMKGSMGIIRNGKDLEDGINVLDGLIGQVREDEFDSSLLPYFTYSTEAIVVLGKAAMTAALARTESRGAHQRSEYKEEKDEYCAATLISYDGGRLSVSYDKEGRYEH